MKSGDVLLPDVDPRDNNGEKWEACVRCGAKYRYSELPFDDGSIEPEDASTLTGATSGDTGVVAETTVYSGSWEGKDASGFITLSSPTGIDKDTGRSFEDNESIDADSTVSPRDEDVFVFSRGNILALQDNGKVISFGDTWGSHTMLVNGTASSTTYGRLYPTSEMVVWRGKRYCSAHARAIIPNILSDELQIDIHEDDRGSEW